MSADLERDLGAWTRGELARDRLLATYGAEAAGSVALHDRLTEMAAGSAIPAVEAGWAALSVKLDAPAAVVPLRRHHRRRRTVSILVAAALIVAGSAFAAIVSSRPHDAPAPRTSTTVTAPVPGVSFAGVPNDRRLVPPPSSSGTGSHPGGTGPSSGGGSGTSDNGSTGGADGSASTDDPRDRDRGTGNDGSHDDQGSGNNGPSGTLPRRSRGH